MNRVCALVFLFTSACTGAAPSAPTDASSAAATPAPPLPPPPPPPTATATAAPPPVAAAPTGAASAAPAEAPVPSIKLENIGMHIGGGPNDAVTKEPIKKSVSPHFDELRRCWTKVEPDTKGGDFGVDLLIDKDGGKPLKVTHPKTTLKGEGFKECMVTVFEAIDFLKPKKGKTMVSYSVRFSK